MITMKPEMMVDVCVCTYRRPHVSKTLNSLSQLEIPEGIAFRVIVADNDVGQSARASVEAVAAECNLHVDYIHAPARNISVARNACLDFAKGDSIAFIDDD